MKVIILAGGFGTRLSEYTESIPKPMVKIGDKPIIWHIMQRYAKFNHKDFYLALGYKSEIIKEYFINYQILNSNFSINLSNNKIKTFDNKQLDWNVNLINTGQNSMTGGRVKKLKEYIGRERCMLTYGDGIANIDFDQLLNFHKSHGKLVTVTAVRPSARFGEIEIKHDKVIKFKEKPQINEGWINGGFFIIEPDFFNLINDDQTSLEGEPLELASKMGELMAYQHCGFWQCMDTKRDRDILERFWASKNPPW